MVSLGPGRGHGQNSGHSVGIYLLRTVKVKSARTIISYSYFIQ